MEIENQAWAEFQARKNRLNYQTATDMAKDKPAPITRQAKRKVQQPAHSGEDLHAQYLELRAKPDNFYAYGQWIKRLSPQNHETLGQERKRIQAEAKLLKDAQQFVIKEKERKANLLLLYERSIERNKMQLAAKELKKAARRDKNAVAASRIKKQAIVVDQSEPEFVMCPTGVAPNGQIILLIDQKTKIYLKPGRDPVMVYKRFLERNTS